MLGADLYLEISYDGKNTRGDCKDLKRSLRRARSQMFDPNREKMNVR